MQRQLFWIHIKKSAGITTRKLLQPYYQEVDRRKNPINYLQASPSEYNDIVNNYRVVLGNYQFRRSLFAKKYLYPDNWESLYSFAFVREPEDRCVSMFFYLYQNNPDSLGLLRKYLSGLIRKGRVFYTLSNQFDEFLDLVNVARSSDTIFLPVSLHFTTHTARMWDDISDLEGNQIITQVFRMENLTAGINTVFESCGIDKRVPEGGKRINVNKRRKPFEPTPDQKKKIISIYDPDFHLYESTPLIG